MLQANPNLTVTLTASGGGAFELRRDGELIFSKLTDFRYPEDAELEAFATAS